MQKLFALIVVFVLIEAGNTISALLFLLCSVFSIYLSYLVLKVEGYKDELQDFKYKKNNWPIPTFLVFSMFTIIYLYKLQSGSMTSSITVLTNKDEFFVTMIFFALFISRIREGVK
jgi:hypothetical protein